MLAFIRRFIADDSGVNAIEYSLAIGLGVMASLGMAGEITGRIDTLYKGINEVLEGALNGRPVVKPFRF